MSEEKKPRSGAVSKVLALIGETPITASKIKHQCPDLNDQQISMALTYLRDKRKVIDCVKVPRTANIGPKEVKAYFLRQAA